MALDAYQPCPTGIDKKIKFCCGADILDDLAKIDEALAGEQRLAALDLCNRLLEKKPDRACLLMHKSLVQLGLGEMAPCRDARDHERDQRAAQRDQHLRARQVEPLEPRAPSDRTAA